MNTLQFKTNIKCGGCVATVTPGLNQTAGENNWQVDLQSPDRILTVQGNSIQAADIKQAVEKAGFKAEPVQ
ncbi:heavy-metal-associated domain-containing protein [Paraflavitalea pollutisoli]|uniref:heavy-metal-associated domain-containing protein n=1 Tax=Paraflavitalea pollutisoli TaxID=3034143 RepID=UPI0023ECAD34|nr:heavy-metal-associated domain-containing protein [Paraflavitalea sp. H1-2-19X]